ncbi:MAG: methylmalonyl Co-A mutase-associated GTPase MeaB [Syntrophales bacterium]|nr:methylmalonyl Co-A mutase-associated GTPase MeaB [Syntrophales bacterium]
MVRKIRMGDVRTASRLIRCLEDGEEDARSAMKYLFPFTGRAHVVGITGSPGAGKSTLLDGLVESRRKIGNNIGVLAVDPTSPFTGGAILGDRIRMQRHAEDPGVFVRSLATRGALGGLSKAVGDAVHIMDVMGKDMIFVETVGTGQQEIDIINHSHTVVVVLIPGMGDGIQAIKAGIMEIADIFVINKADRPGTSKLHRELKALLDLAAPTSFHNGWRPPIIQVEDAFKPEPFGKSIQELSDTIDKHYQSLQEHECLRSRLHRKAETELKEAMQVCIMDTIFEGLISSGEEEMMINEILNKKSDPYSLAKGMAERLLKKHH